MADAEVTLPSVHEDAHAGFEGKDAGPEKTAVAQQHRRQNRKGATGTSTVEAPVPLHRNRCRNNPGAGMKPLADIYRMLSAVA